MDAPAADELLVQIDAKPTSQRREKKREVAM